MPTHSQPPPRPVGDGFVGIGIVAVVAVLAAGAGGADLWAVGVVVASVALLPLLVARRLRTACRPPTDALLVVARAASSETRREAATAQLAMELALDRAHSVLDALREGVLVVDGAAEVVLANPAVRRSMLPIDGPLTGRSLRDVLQPELGRRAYDAWEALRSGGEPVRYSAILCGDHVFDLTAVPVRSAQSGHDFGTVFLIVDSTRAHELARLKDRFLSSISHELRTPLTNICAYSEILRQMVPGESVEWPEFVRVIHDEGLALSRLVDCVFDFLQLESGDAVFEMVEMDATATVKEIVVDIAGRAAAAGVDLEFRVEGMPPKVQVDSRRLGQVVRNLVDNGLKFTPAGGRVLVTVGEREGNWLLRIDDSGPGVPNNQRQAVFEKFHQLSDHMTEKPTGAGLGLATSRVIVARFGGMIWCEDSALGGSGFVVMLPAVGQPHLVPVGAGTGAGGGF